MAGSIGGKPNPINNKVVEDLKRFYFTFGTNEHFPFIGGWVVVFANDRKEAVEIFRKHHPDHTPGIINCSDIYTESQFQSSGMVDGNLGCRCHAVYGEEGSCDV